MKKLLFITAIIFCFFAQAAVEVKTAPSQGDVQFEAIGKPSMVKIKGKGEGAVAALTVDQGKVNGDIRFKLETLNTGIGMRDDHMKEKYLQVKEHPEAVVTFKDVAIPAAWSVKSPVLPETDFKAQMKLHGVEKEISGKLQIENAKLTGRANFEIKLSDFNIDIPTYLGVKVADIVKVSVNFTAMDATEKKSEAAPVQKKK